MSPDFWEGEVSQGSYFPLLVPREKGRACQGLRDSETEHLH